MAGRDETRIPLLADTDDTEQPLLDDIEVEYPLRTPPRDEGSDSQPILTPSSSGGLGVGGKVRKKHYSGSEMIVVVFVVAFDTKKGA